MTLKIDNWGLLEARREISETYPNHECLESFPNPTGSFRFQMIWDGEIWTPIERLSREIETERKPRKPRRFERRSRRIEREKVCDE